MIEEIRCAGCGQIRKWRGYKCLDVCKCSYERPEDEEDVDPGFWGRVAARLSEENKQLREENERLKKEAKKTSRDDSWSLMKRPLGRT